MKWIGDPIIKKVKLLEWCLQLKRNIEVITTFNVSQIYYKVTLDFSTYILWLTYKCFFFFFFDGFDN